MQKIIIKDSALPVITNIVKASEPNLVPENIKKDVDILGVIGTYGGGEPGLTEFAVGDVITSNTRAKFNTNLGTQEVENLIKQILGEEDEVYLVMCKDDDNKDSYYIKVGHEYEEGQEVDAYFIGINTTEMPVFASGILPEGFTAGWQDTLDENGEINIYQDGYSPVTGLNGTAGWNGVLVGRVEGEPAGGLIEFYEGQVINGFDFGDVQNGQTSDEIETFIANFCESAQTEPPILVDVTPDHQNALFCNTIDGILVIGVTDENDTVIYASQAVQEEGITQGWQKLTNGKYLFETSVVVSHVYDDEQDPTWNGVFIGAVESEGSGSGSEDEGSGSGSEDEGSGSGSHEPLTFQVGDTPYGLAVDTNAFSNQQLDSMISQLVSQYGDQGQLVLMNGDGGSDDPPAIVATDVNDEGYRWLQLIAAIESYYDNEYTQKQKMVMYSYEAIPAEHNGYDVEVPAGWSVIDVTRTTNYGSGSGSGSGSSSTTVTATATPITGKEEFVYNADGNSLTITDISNAFAAFNGTVFEKLDN